MVEKNVFLIYNQVLSELYRCRNYACLGQYFLPMLKLLIPAPYASILRSEEREGHIFLLDPLCVPAAFIQAERNYMRYADADQTGWLGRCREATIFRESDLVADQERLHSTIYQKCYQPYGIYDTLFYAVVHNGRHLGVLSLFRCRQDGPFTEEELFLLKAIGSHLNQHMATLLDKSSRPGVPGGGDLSAVAAKYGLTARETELLELLTRFRNNHEIAEALQVRGSTLQKHFQNMFRKLGVTSRWEVMRLLLELDMRS